MVQGQKLKLTFNGRTVDASVRFGSDNLKSLLVTFDCALSTPSGGAYLGEMPLLLDESRNCYIDLITGTEAGVKWL